eukprot:Platyproteum_vivax@DN12253_c0_g1_i1.p1
MATEPKKPTRSFKRIVVRSLLLTLVAAASGLFIQGFWLLFMVSISIMAILLDTVRQQYKIVPFSIYLACVYTFQILLLVMTFVPFSRLSTTLDAVNIGTAVDAVEVVKSGQGFLANSITSASPNVIEHLIETVAPPLVTTNTTSPVDLRTISIVLAAHNEQKYIVRTLESIFERTPEEVLQEVIIVDDASTPSMESALEKYTGDPRVKVVLNPTRIGLIRSKIAGGNASTGDLIVFLDAHVKPDWKWVQPLLKHTNTNYKRVVVPIIPVLDGNTWIEKKAQAGAKMMFDWTLGFQWFDDHNDLVPCMSGGLFAITKKWWKESGEYDPAMQDWGGENIEQSLRIWLCGGEIYVARDSMVSHVFREKFPYAIDADKVQRNKVIAVETWFGNYTDMFYERSPYSKKFQESVLEGLLERRKQLSHLDCKPFQWYLDKFKAVFEMKGMLPSNTFLIRETSSNLCLSYDDKASYIVAIDCNTNSKTQRWFKTSDNTIHSMGKHDHCLDANNVNHSNYRFLIYHCVKGNHNQLGWGFNQGRLTYSSWCATIKTDNTTTAIPQRNEVLLDSCQNDPSDPGGYSAAMGQRFMATDFNQQAI